MRGEVERVGDALRVHVREHAHHLRCHELKFLQGKSLARFRFPPIEVAEEGNGLDVLEDVEKFCLRVKYETKLM